MTLKEGYRVAVRWRLAGTHGRYGMYGKPTGRRVNVLGISHLHVKDDKITKHITWSLTSWHC